MHIKTGIDIVHIQRIEKIIENREVLNKIFSKKELKIINPEHLAGIFALKEAFFKALNMKPKWLAIEVINKKSGEPKMNMSNEIKILLNSKNFQSRNLVDISCSISHDNEYAIANVIILIE